MRENGTGMDNHRNTRKQSFSLMRLVFGSHRAAECTQAPGYQHPLPGARRLLLRGGAKSEEEVCRHASDPYAFENTQRVLSTLLAIFEADTEAVFPKPRAGGLFKPIEDQLLLLGWNDRLERRSVQGTYPLVAELPIQGRLNRGVTSNLTSARKSSFARTTGVYLPGTRVVHRQR